jgi:hypothetical protein
VSHSVTCCGVTQRDQDHELSAMGCFGYHCTLAAPLEENAMNRSTMFVMTALAATLFCSPGSKALAQQPSSSSVALQNFARR